MAYEYPVCVAHSYWGFTSDKLWVPPERVEFVLPFKQPQKSPRQLSFEELEDPLTPFKQMMYELANKHMGMMMTKMNGEAFMAELHDRAEQVGMNNVDVASKALEPKFVLGPDPYAYKSPYGGGIEITVTGWVGKPMTEIQFTFTVA